MDPFNVVKNVRILYFSGTGSTKRYADAFENELKCRGIDVFVENLGGSFREKAAAPEVQENSVRDLDILLYPVYAMDAPRPVYDWIESLASPESEGLQGQEARRRIAVLSVSGGGEMWPNTGCRNDCCKALEEKGFQVVYDWMLCMPANVLLEYNDHLVMHLINIIPKKVNQMTDDLLEGRIRRSREEKGFFCKKLSKTERNNSFRFAERFQITDECTGCARCERNCPMGNIEIPESGSKPGFRDRCIICMRCIYSCPSNAVKAKGNFVLKNGFDLEEAERRMKDVELEPVEKCCRGLLYIGVKKYLLDKE